MIEREEIFAYVKEKFDTEPDYPWFKYPDYAVIRHEGGKWYGLGGITCFLLDMNF